MPKITNTKKQRAITLLQTVATGPAFLSNNQKEKEQYALWVRTWVLPELVRLVPDLEKLAKEGNLESNLEATAKEIVANRLK